MLTNHNFVIFRFYLSTAQCPPYFGGMISSTEPQGGEGSPLDAAVIKAIPKTV
jgi:hypothetical protein